MTDLFYIFVFCGVSAAILIYLTGAILYCHQQYRPKIQPVNTRSVDYKQAAWDKIKQEYSVGDNVVYLSVPMVITGFREYMPCILGPRNAFTYGVVGAIICDYADHQGVIHIQEFESDKWKFIKHA
jgi:hypothetical protein